MLWSTPFIATGGEWAGYAKRAERVLRSKPLRRYERPAARQLQREGRRTIEVPLLTDVGECDASGMF